MRFLVSLRLYQLLAALALLLLSPADAIQAAPFAGKRVALVVGNSKYPTAPLRNPGNDARAIAKSLKDLGFEVTLRENASQRDLAVAIRQFGTSITPGSAALFYFAGHGMQVKGRNYLVPVDADIQVEDEVPYSAIDANLVLDKMEVGKSAVNIVILDACRNNPFSRRFRSAATGLAEMIAPIGTLIAFATAPGSVAQDGAGENGVYTKHLLESIAVPGLPVEQMFKRVRVGVARETNEGQVPWESSSMKGDFAFREAPAQQAVSQEKLIEEAARAAAERAATLTAERMSREQAARQPQNDRARAEQEALAAEREKLLRERDRLTAENEALRRKPAQAPESVALAAPTLAARPPVTPAKSAGGNRPAVGDRWTYRFTDKIYGKSETYTVQLTSASNEEMADEARIGKEHHAASFEAGLSLTDRKLGNLSIREISPYLLSYGPLQEKPEWKKLFILGGNHPFTATIAGLETVKVPVGTFDSYKVVIEGTQQHSYYAGSMRQYNVTAWYAPVAKRFIKMEIDAQGSTGELARVHEIIELVGVNFPLSEVAATPMPAAEGRPVASLAPAGGSGNRSDLPKVGDSWTYRFSDIIYGKSETYTVRVTAASANEIADEARLGKARHAAGFAPGLELRDRKLGQLALREISPYLLNFGPIQETADWKNVVILNNSNPFTARLAGMEVVQVPAGKFDAYKVVISGMENTYYSTMISRTYVVTVWYAPKAKRLVKLSFVGNPASNISAENQTIELTELRLQ